MKVGLIGAGLQGKRRAQALQGFDAAELVIVADADWARAKLLTDEIGCLPASDWEEVIARKDIEAIIICTPPHLQAPMCVAALKQGKHVFCEKPMARTVKEAREVVKVAEENGLILKCGFNLRHHPAISQAKRWVEAGTIGELMFIRCRYGIGGRPGYEKDWRMNLEISGGGEMMDQGMHTLDLARWFLGDFESVFGSLQTGFWNSRVEDNAFAILRTNKGQTASIHVSWTQWKNLFSFEVFGKDGYIIIEGLGGSYGTEKLIMGKKALEKPFKEETTEFRGADLSWREEWQEFVTAIRENREPLGSGYDGLKALRLAHAVYDSASKGCTVEVEK